VLPACPPGSPQFHRHYVAPWPRPYTSAFFRNCVGAILVVHTHTHTHTPLHQKKHTLPQLDVCALVHSPLAQTKPPRPEKASPDPPPPSLRTLSASYSSACLCGGRCRSLCGWGGRSAHRGLALSGGAGGDGSCCRLGLSSCGCCGGILGCLWLLACGVRLALELAGGAWAVDGAVALPIAAGGLAHALAQGVGVVAQGVAHGVAAHGGALGAAALLALVGGAAHLAVGLGALDLALGAGELFAASGAVGCLAHGLAHLRNNNRQTWEEDEAQSHQQATTKNKPLEPQRRQATNNRPCCNEHSPESRNKSYRARIQR
jgi:hypothetical protein